MDDEGLDDYFWADLIQYIKDDSVVPIIGPDLVSVVQPEGDVPLYRHIARGLVPALRVPAKELGDDYTLNDVVGRYLDTKNATKATVYSRILGLLKDNTLAPPRCLLDLASIRPLKLFVSTTFDPQLVNAINAERFGGIADTEVIAYSPGNVQDLKVDKKSLAHPVVYHLLGKVSASPDYVVCDEDVLEFLHAMQAEARQPHLLFDELKNNHLLILGCNFSDWLSRFFVRLAKGQPLSTQRDHFEFVVDSTAAQDTQLTLFYNHFSANTKILRGTPADFVSELARRWHEKYPQQDEPQASAAMPAAGGDDGGVVAANTIFISYASEDVLAAERIKDALEAADLNIWFDKKRLGAGESWDYKIRHNIRNCALFMPVISAATEQKVSYFRKEWVWAADRALEFPPSMPFLVPVALDPLKPETAEVPECFRIAQWTRLPEGQVTPEFAERLKQMVRERQKRQQTA